MNRKSWLPLALAGIAAVATVLAVGSNDFVEKPVTPSKANAVIMIDGPGVPQPTTTSITAIDLGNSGFDRSIKRPTAAILDIHMITQLDPAFRDKLGKLPNFGRILASEELTSYVYSDLPSSNTDLPIKTTVWADRSGAVVAIEVRNGARFFCALPDHAGTRDKSTLWLLNFRSAMGERLSPRQYLDVADHKVEMYGNYEVSCVRVLW